MLCVVTCSVWLHVVVCCYMLLFIIIQIGSGMLGEGFPPIEVNTGLVSYYPEYSGFGEFIGIMFINCIWKIQGEE